MTVFENECVGCPSEMGCLGSSCPYIDVPRHYCDDCGEEAELYVMSNGDELCSDCLKKKLKRGKREFCDECGDYDDTYIAEDGRELCFYCVKELYKEKTMNLCF